MIMGYEPELHIMTRSHEHNFEEKEAKNKIKWIVPHLYKDLKKGKLKHSVRNAYQDQEEK